MKKLAKYVSALIICLFSSILLVACGEPTITSAYIKEGTIVTSVDRGSAKTALNLNNAKAVIKFSDGSEIEVDASKLTFGDIDLSTIGNDKQLKVKYGEFEFVVEIDVVKPHVTSAYIKAGTVNTSVVVGSALNLANAVAVVNYSNGEQIEVAAADLGFNMATLDLTTVGNNKPLKITYDGFEFYINIAVVSDPEDAIVRATSGIITKGSIVDTVIEGATVAELGLDNATALITYDNGTSETVELSAANFTTTGLDLTTVGTKTVKVTYVYNTEKNLAIEFYVQIIVNPVPEEQKIILTDFSSDLIDEMDSNSGDKANKETEFYDRTVSHKVGDDNALNFRINAKGVIDDNPVENIKGVKTQVKVQEVVSGTPTDLSAQDYAKYVETTTYESVDFSKDAVGKTFKVTVTATNYDPDYFEGIPSFDLTFDVVDGYNVYEAKELSLFDNANIENAWTELKTLWGLNDVTTKALVLQNSIHVTDDVIPAKFFYTEKEVADLDQTKFNPWTNLDVEGTLKDGAGDEDMLYFRYLKDGEEFHIYGNYFDISVADKTDSRGDVIEKGLSRSVISETDDNGIVISESGNSYLTTHTALFKVQGGKVEGGQLINCNNGAEHTSSKGILTVRDTYFIGNGRRSVDPLASGGIILLKSESVNLDVINTINKDWFIGWMTEYGYDLRDLGAFPVLGENPTQQEQQEYAQKFMAWTDVVNNGNKLYNSHTNILKSKGYNNYSSLMYFWGTPNVVIGDCEFIGAGGPVIVCDQVTGDYDDFTASGHPMGAGDNYFNYLMGSGGFAPVINIYNSKLESYVNGLEAWFATYPGATAQFAQIVTANEAFTGVGKQSSFLKEYDGTPNATNLIALHKWGAKRFDEVAVFTRGEVNKFETEADYLASIDVNAENDPAYFGYDRSIVFDSNYLTGNADAPFNYDPNNGAYTQKTALINAQYVQKIKPEMVRFENSTNGYSVGLGDGYTENLGGNPLYQDRVDLTDSGMGTSASTVFTRAATGSTYLNVYMANGFGAMMELFPYTPPTED